MDKPHCGHSKASTFQRFWRKPKITSVLYPWPVLPEQTNDDSSSVVVDTVVVAAADAVVLGRPRRHVAAGDTAVTYGTQIRHTACMVVDGIPTAETAKLSADGPSPPPRDLGSNQQ